MFQFLNSQPRIIFHEHIQMQISRIFTISNIGTLTTLEISLNICKKGGESQQGGEDLKRKVNPMGRILWFTNRHFWNQIYRDVLI